MEKEIILENGFMLKTIVRLYIKYLKKEKLERIIMLVQGSD